VNRHRLDLDAIKTEWNGGADEMDEYIPALVDELYSLRLAFADGYALSTWAASIKWNDRDTNTQEWLDGLRERIERVQAHGEKP